MTRKRPIGRASRRRINLTSRRAFASTGQLLDDAVDEDGRRCAGSRTGRTLRRRAERPNQFATGSLMDLAHKVLRCPVDAAPSGRFAYSLTNLVGLKALIVLASIFNTYTIHVMFSGHAWAITAQ